MLALPKRFPIAKVSSLGVGVFAIGFVGSIALLTYFHPGSSDESGTNVATHQSSTAKTANKKKAVASAESEASTKTTSHSTVKQPALTSGSSGATQPVAKYTAPSSSRATTSAATPVATTGGSGGSSVLNVTSAPTPTAPLQVAPQPTSPTPSPAPSTGSSGGSLLQPVKNLTTPVVNKANNLLGN